LYTIKRAIHPLSWLEMGLHPALQTIASGKLIPFGSDGGGDKPSFMKIDIDRTGPNSGYGPKFILRHDFTDPNVKLEGLAQYTYRRYGRYQLTASLPLMQTAPAQPESRVSLQAIAAYRSRPSDEFFGIGNDTSFDSRIFYHATVKEGGVALVTDLGFDTKASLGFVKRNIDVDANTDAISLEHAVQNPAIAAALTGANLHAFVFTLSRNTKDNQELPSRGGIQRAEISFNAGNGEDQRFAYWKYRLDLQQYIPVSKSGRSVIALRAGAETNQERRGRSIPFADLPIAGSWETLRGYADQRFYDKSVLTVGAEYRYRIWQAFDWGLFADAGQVAPEPGGFGIDRFHPAYGFRLIARATPRNAVTFDFARSREGWSLYFIVHPSF
jgi:outer membrane protein assembly factor BamA